jgi:CRP/FNR family transcriptional regulator, cyclic AMP receptor protein
MGRFNWRTRSTTITPKGKKVSTSFINLPAWFQNIPQGVLGHKTILIKARKALFAQGDECSRVYHINHGIVKLSTLSAQGKSAVVSILGPGDLVGVECLTGEKTHQTTAVALVESTAVRMRSALLIRLLHERPATAAQFVDYMLKRYVQVERDLINHLINTSEKRLARALLLLDRYSKEVDSSILATITQDTLADIVGTTRSRVNFFMNQFRKEGYVEYDRGLKIKSSLQQVLR